MERVRDAQLENDVGMKWKTHQGPFMHKETGSLEGDLHTTVTGSMVHLEHDEFAISAESS